MELKVIGIEHRGMAANDGAYTERAEAAKPALSYLCVYVPTSIIGYVVSNIVLALIFFFLFMPLGALLRLMGKDLLQLRAIRGQTKWGRIEEARDENRYFRQF